MEDVFRTIPAFFKDEEMPAEMREAVAIGAWKKAVGGSILENSAVTGLEEKTLKVAVRDEVWKRHLESLAGQMIFKLNSILRFPMVTYIEFTVDEQSVIDSRKEGPEPTIPEKVFEAEAVRQRTDLETTLTAMIDDPALRELFLDAAGRCMARHFLMVERGLLPIETDHSD